MGVLHNRDMSALLGEPFVLANYPIPSQNFPKSVGTSKIKGNRYVRASGCSSDHGEGFVTVTVQGDGVHVLELSNMHAAVSHTLGPSAFFAASSVTRLNNSEASTSYAVMRTAPGGIEMTDRDKTVWKWRDRHARRPEEQPEPKHSAVFPYCVEEIWAPSGLPCNVIAVSPSGDVVLSDENLQIMSSIEVSYSQSNLLKSFVFGPEECTFLLHRRNQPHEMVVICFIMVASHIKLRIILAQATGELQEITECDLGVFEDIIGISCDPSGYTSILAQRGDWRLFQLGRDSAGAVTAASLDKALILTGLFPTQPANGGKQIKCDPTIISVGSSFVLLAGISGDDPSEIVLLLWDIQYSTVLATQKFALPSTVIYSPKSPPILELVPASRSQALLVLSPSVITTLKHTVGAVPTRSTVLVVPLAIPPTSTIALAMGMAHDTQQWLRDTRTDSTHAAISGEDRGRRQVMQSVRQALEQGNPQAAETAFFIWVENEKDKWKGPSSPHLSHQFVSNLLNGILRPSKPSDVSYSSKIVQYLISRQAVSHAMVEGGLLPALRHHRDWLSIASAFDNVHDLSEHDMIFILLEVVKSHRLRQDSNSDGMLVDAPVDVPSLPSFLATLVVYPSSPSMLRQALKTHLTDARDIIFILEVLEGWLAWWCNTNSGLALDLANLPNDGVHASNTNKKLWPTGRSKTPSLRSVMAFLQSVLDVYFLTLLQYTPSHGVIEGIKRHIHEQLLSVEALDRLRGPLEAFVRAQAQKSLVKRRELQSGGDSKQRHKGDFKAAELAIGLYQVEELVI